MMRIILASFISSIIAPYIWLRNPKVSLAIAITDAILTGIIFALLQ